MRAELADLHRSTGPSRSTSGRWVKRWLRLTRRPRTAVGAGRSALCSGLCSGGTSRGLSAGEAAPAGGAVSRRSAGCAASCRSGACGGAARRSSRTERSGDGLVRHCSLTASRPPRRAARQLELPATSVGRPTAWRHGRLRSTRGGATSPALDSYSACHAHLIVDGWRGGTGYGGLLAAQRRALWRSRRAGFSPSGLEIDCVRRCRRAPVAVRPHAVCGSCSAHGRGRRRAHPAPWRASRR